VPFDDGMQTSPESARGSEAAPDVRSNGGSAGAGSARSQVHIIRPVGSLIGDRFVVKAHIGRGRNGERYEAIDRSLSDPDVQSERSVVLCILNARVAQQTRVLEKLEASYLHPHSWAHRNVVSVLAFGSDRGEYYFVTEALEGETLRTILDEVAPELVSEEETFSVLSGIGDALKYAHAKRVIHGDIRPENTFVTTDLVVKVLDLLPATVARTVPLFPEDKDTNGSSVPDPRDDVFGLACVAYELFTGKHPFNSNTALEALAAGLKPAPIPRLDARSWDALARGLALRREQRTANVAAFLADLGVTGRERLRRDREAERPATEANDAVEIADDMTPRAPTPAPAAIRAAAAARTAAASAWRFDDHGGDQDNGHYERLRMRLDDELRRRSTRPFPWIVVLAIAVSAAVYLNYGWLQQHGPEWIATGRGMVAGISQSKTTTPPADAKSEPGANSADAATPSPRRRVPDAAPSSAPPAASSAQPPTTSGSTPARTEPPPASAAPEQARSSVAVPNGAAPAQTAPPKQASPQTSATVDASPSRAPQLEPTVAAAEPPAPETFEPEKPVVVVSEAAPSAAITIRRHGGPDAPTTFVWWTSDGTAVADEDYVNLGARIEKLAAGEQTRTIHVPIIHDPKRKGPGSFYVNVRPGQSKRDDPAQRVEVVLSR